MKGKSSLANLTAFYDDMTSSEDGGRAMDVGYFDFCKAFEAVSYNILTDKQ